MTLRGKVALVTGGASGIGRAAAAEFARRGAAVAIAYNPRHPHDGDAAADAIAAGGGTARAYPIDVTDGNAVEGLFDAIAADLGEPSIVLANAAVARRVPLDGPWATAWEEVMSINLSGTYRTFMSAIPRLRDQGGGRLLATTSVSGPVVGWPEHVAYCASKAGVVGMIRALALDVAPYAITVNAVAPGTIRSPQSLDPVNSLGADALDRLAASIPLGRVGDPEDVAGVFAFLASEDARYITGQVLVVDGGVTLMEAV